jgi:hypothetical protein
MLEEEKVKVESEKGSGLRFPFSSLRLQLSGLSLPVSLLPLSLLTFTPHSFWLASTA